MNRISTRFFIIFVTLLVLLLSSVVVLNSIFLEQYFINKNRDVLLEYEAIIKTMMDNQESLVKYVMELDRDEGISTMVVDNTYQITISSFFMVKKEEPNIVPNELKIAVDQFKTKPRGSNLYETVTDANGTSKYIVLIGEFNSNRYLILRKSMKELVNNASIANEFILFTGLAVGFIGVIIMAFYAGRLAKPIKDIDKIAGKIAKLDFSEKVKVTSKDELGTLSKSINTMSEALEENIGTLKRNIESRKALIRNITHEFKTPICVIKGYAEAIKYEFASDPEAYFDTIVEECNRMDVMVKELLDQSTYEDGTKLLEKQSINPGPFLDTLKNRLAKPAEEKSQSIELYVDSSEPIYGEIRLLDRAISNYITNAIKYGKEGRPISIYYYINDKYQVIEVHNKGFSIPEEKHEEIFEAFFKLDDARRKEAGQGLGLSIVKSIVKLHDGLCGLSNEKNGVTFFIKLPRISDNKKHNI